MKYLVDSREMQKYDANTISHFKVPGLLLMERAAIAFVEELHRQNVDLTEVLIVCGSGNNGGDGLAIARLYFWKDMLSRSFMPEIKSTVRSQTGYSRIF